jgi:hypothetical protein
MVNGYSFATTRTIRKKNQCNTKRHEPLQRGQRHYEKPES